MNIKAACTPPCTAAASYELPGTGLIEQLNADTQGGSASNPIFVNASAGDTDADWTATAVSATHATANTWVELFPADASRTGGFIQSKAASGSIYIMPFDGPGVPTSGSKPGEIEVPPRPSFYGFDVEPDRRWVVRGDATALAFSAATW